MIENWICTMQYGTEVIRLAYDATVDAIGKPSIAYANTILERWYAEGYRTVDDVTAAMEAYRRQKLGGSSFDIDDFFEEIDFAKPESFACEYSTMGGWAVEMLDSDPHVGDSFRYENLFVIVAQMQNECVSKLTVLVEQKPEEEAVTL